ncbi:MAG: PGF-CTERM sorting domain-containing protein [Haloarcula sp.]
MELTEQSAETSPEFAATGALVALLSAAVLARRRD